MYAWLVTFLFKLASAVCACGVFWKIYKFDLTRLPIGSAVARMRVFILFDLTRLPIGSAVARILALKFAIFCGLAFLEILRTKDLKL